MEYLLKNEQADVYISERQSLLMMQYIGGALVTGVVALITLLLNRKWKVKDEKKAKEEAKEEANKEIMTQLAEIKDALNKHIDSNDRYMADQSRIRILRFSDELRRDLKQSEESFNTVLEDIDFYVHYCEEHKDTYVNSKAEAAINNIKTVHAKGLSGEYEFL